MKKALPYIIIVVIVIVAGVGFYESKHNKSNNTNTNTSTTTHSSTNMSTMKMGSSTKSGSSSTSTSSVATDAVKIQNYSFSPSSITVKKGTTVTWTNFDSVSHTVTETDGKTGPNSGDIATGKTYSFTYDQTGTFAYHCQIHPDMVGQVVVTD